MFSTVIKPTKHCSLSELMLSPLTVSSHGPRTSSRIQHAVALCSVQTPTLASLLPIFVCACALTFACALVSADEVEKPFDTESGSPEVTAPAETKDSDTSSQEEAPLPAAESDLVDSQEDSSPSTDADSASADQKEAPSVDVEFNSFSAAFVNVLQSIQEGDEQQRPTPAHSPSEGSALESFVVAVEPLPEAPAKRTLDLATEVESRHPIPEKTQPYPAPEKIEPSVAGIASSKRSRAAAGGSRLSSDLDQYFDELPGSPDPENQTASSTSPQDTPSQEDTTAAGESSHPGPAPTASPDQQETPNRIPPQEPPVRITRRMASLQPRIAKTLQFYFDRPLNTGDDSAWSVMHSMLGYGPKGMVAINHERGQRANAAQWMCQNGVCANRRLLFLKDGYIHGVEGAGYQGHPGQFLAMLAQIGIERDYPMNVQGQRFTVDALVNSEMYTCSSSKELTFKLIALSYYLDSNATWKSENGEIWNLPKLLSIELAQPVNGAACGGTHRIMSISCAIRNRWIRGEPMDGVFAKAETYVRQYQRYALSLQNRNGSFSTEWFKRPASSNDRDRQLQTTGHILEWLVYTLPRNELSDPRIVAAVEFLTNLMTRHRYHDWEVGPRGHAIRALSLYHQRVFERQRPTTPQMANIDIWSSVLR